MNRGSGRSYWNRRGGGGRSWNGRSSNDTPTNQNIDPKGRLMNQSAGRSHNRRNYSNSNSRSNNRRYGPSIESFDTIEEIGERTPNSLSIAIEGCCHGQLTAIYDRLRKYEDEEVEADVIEETFSSAHGTSADENMQATARQSKPKKKKIDLLICCGDFQSIRTPADFHSLAVPAKYREMGTFHKYYNEEWVAPILTIFCGGNHEASQPLSELYYGGWVAPKMYYLGAAGVVRYRGIRIGGLSGIYKSHDHYQSRNEIPPYDQKQLRSVYHYRNVDVYRLSCLKTEWQKSQSDHGHVTSHNEASQRLQEVQPMRRLDIMVSHDWPQGIEQYGDVNDLVRRKPFFRQEISENALGSPPAAHLLHTLQPLYWFAAHLHVKFHAKVVHRNIVDNTGSSLPSIAAISKTNDLIPSQVFQAKIRNTSVDANETICQTSYELKDPPSVATSDDKNNDDSEQTSASAKHSTTHFVVPESLSCQNPLTDLTEQMTQFLSLDKCLPRRQYLSILHLPVADNRDSENDEYNDLKLEYDLEWLAILRKTHHLAASSHPHRVQLPQMIQTNGGISCPHQVTDADITWVKERIGDDMAIPENFTRTLTQKYDEQSHHAQPPPLPRMGNPQTDYLLNLLGLEHLPNLTIPFSEEQSVLASPPSATIESLAFDAGDDNEIDLDDDIDQTFNTDVTSSTSAIVQSYDTLLPHETKKPRIDGGSE